jgi:Mrp family chromosome partitioning ATPase
MTPPNASLVSLRPSDGSSVALLAVRPGGELVAASSTDAATADGYLRLTAHILLRAEREGFRSIGVLSAREGEGRTAAAVNLAVCLGRTRGRVGRVLLVDGDSRHRTLSKMFCGSATAMGVVRHPMLVGTTFEGVDVMTAPENSDGLTIHAPQAWIAAFTELGRDYRHIVIDCPPVLESAEGVVLRECVDELVLVVESGTESRAQIERTVGSVGGRVLGVILHGHRSEDAR